MGLDIFLHSNNDKLFSGLEYDYYHHHSLSRTFCNLMCRRDVVANEQPELDQIGKITGIDIAPLYQMSNYPTADAMEWDISSAKTEKERQAIIKRSADDKHMLDHNLEKISLLIHGLIARLTHINNLPSLLAGTKFDTIPRDTYFKDFTIDTGDGYIGNNFGQDLRNFRSFLDLAKRKGATGVHFTYG